MPLSTAITGSNAAAMETPLMKNELMISMDSCAHSEARWYLQTLNSLYFCSREPLAWKTNIFPIECSIMLRV